MNNGAYPPNGIICTPEEYAISISDSPIHTTIHCLTRGESIGLTVVSQAGLLSLTAVAYVFIIIIKNVVWRLRNITRDKWRIFQEPTDLLMFSLFSADVLQAVGGVMDIKWVHDGRVQVGEFCDAQGIVQQLGETGVAITTLTIAIYTFVGIWMGRGLRSMRLTVIVVSSTWLFVIFMVVLGNTVNRGSHKSQYESPTPYWCWISKDYLQMRIWGEYFWFWLTLLFSIAVYVPLYLWSRGNISIDEQRWWKFRWQKADSNVDPALRVVRRRSLIMLLYPLVYCILILPMSIVRWIGFVQESHGGVNRISSTSTLAVAALYTLSGAANVVLLLTTRPDSVLFGKHSYDAVGRAPSPIHSNSSRPGLILDQMASKEMGLDDEGDLGRLPSRT